MPFQPRHLLFALICVIGLASCKKSRKPFEVLEVSAESKGKTQSEKVDFRSRIGIYPAFELSGFIAGVDSAMGPYWIRVSILDEAGKVLDYDFGPKPASVDTTGWTEEMRTAHFASDSTWLKQTLSGPYVAKRPLVWERYLGVQPGPFSVLVPYPVLPAQAPGADVETHVLIEGFFGIREDHDPLLGTIPASLAPADKPDLRSLAVVRYPQPMLRKKTFTVGKVEVDENGDTRPSEWDFGLFSIRDDAGYPDLTWQLQVDDMPAWSAPIRIHNEMEGDFSRYPATVWLAGEKPELMICFMDWDNADLFNNRHDEIGCWEGKLEDLSSNSREPSVLKCGDVKWGEVTVK